MIRTGVGGYDLFDIAMEESVGIYRIRIGNKVPRIIRTKKAIIKKSIAGYWYKLIKTKSLLMDSLQDKDRARYKKEDFSLDLLENAIKDLFSK